MQTYYLVGATICFLRCGVLNSQANIAQCVDIVQDILIWFILDSVLSNIFLNGFQSFVVVAN